jgi:hypothetical protein
VSPLALPPADAWRALEPVARPAIVCWSSWREVRRVEREVRAVVRRARPRVPVLLARVLQLPIPLVCLLERRPFSVAHWLPNMPRGHEDPWGCRAPVIRAATAPGG